MDKLFLFRTLIAAFMLCLFVWDGLQLLAGQAPYMPHRDFLLTAALLWIISVFVDLNNKDDDWAGQL